MGTKRGWPDWVKGIALYGIAPNGDLILVRTDEQGNLTVNLIPHHTTHEQGGSDEIDVTGLKGVLHNLQKAKWSVYDTRANFPSGEEVGALAYATDERKLYRWDGSSWQPVLSMGGWRYFGPKASFPTDVVKGDLAYATDEHSLYRWDGSSWEKVLTEDFTRLLNRLHAATHEFGGDDEINVTGLHGELADPQTPKTHASTHQPGGSDALPTGTPSAITEGVAGSEGSSTAFARADHVHQTPSEWTPKVHGNERHSPEMLPRDGSAPMAGTLFGSSYNPLHVFRQFALNTLGEDPSRLILPGIQNYLAYNLKRGGSLYWSQAPTYGTADFLFDGTSQYVYWNPVPSSLTVEVTFHTQETAVQAVYIHFQSVAWRATDFTVEYYDATNGVWKQIANVAGWEEVLWAAYYNPSPNQVSKIRFTFTGFASTIFAISEIGVVVYKSHPHEYVLKKDVGDMYGDIDMHGNDILSPGLVDGVDVSSHAARHQVGGADEVKPGKYANTQIFSPSDTTPTSYTTLDTGVGCRALVLLRLYNNSGADHKYFFYPGDEAYAPSDANTDSTWALTPVWIGAGAKLAYTWMLTDADGKLKWKADSAHIGFEVRLMAYIKLA